MVYQNNQSQPSEIGRRGFLLGGLATTALSLYPSGSLATEQSVKNGYVATGLYNLEDELVAVIYNKGKPAKIWTNFVFTERRLENIAEDTLKDMVEVHIDDTIAYLSNGLELKMGGGDYINISPANEGGNEGGGDGDGGSGGGGGGGCFTAETKVLMSDNTFKPMQ